MGKTDGTIRFFNAMIQKVLLKIIEFVYFPFKNVLPFQLFRYGVAGGINLVFDWVMYFVFYNFVFRHEVVSVGCLSVSAHIASFVVTFPITFLSGFWLSRYVSFKESELRGGVQLFRYLLVVAACILINYVCLKFFVEVCGIYPTPSKMLTTVITTCFSFLSQKYFTFRA